MLYIISAVCAIMDMDSSTLQSLTVECPWWEAYPPQLHLLHAKKFSRIHLLVQLKRNMHRTLELEDYQGAGEMKKELAALKTKAREPELSILAFYHIVNPCLSVLRRV